jgi:hypothetical protein
MGHPWGAFEGTTLQSDRKRCGEEIQSAWRRHPSSTKKETPEGNLVAGMHWLQATFAHRFNRLRGEHGHLFQGRYKASGVAGDRDCRRLTTIVST